MRFDDFIRMDPAAAREIKHLELEGAATPLQKEEITNLINLLKKLTNLKTLTMAVPARKEEYSAALIGLLTNTTFNTIKFDSVNRGEPLKFYTIKNDSKSSSQPETICELYCENVSTETVYYLINLYPILIEKNIKVTIDTITPSTLKLLARALSQKVEKLNLNFIQPEIKIDFDAMLAEFISSTASSASASSASASSASASSASESIPNSLVSPPAVPPPPAAASRLSSALSGSNSTGLLKAWENRAHLPLRKRAAGETSTPPIDLETLLIQTFAQYKHSIGVTGNKFKSDSTFDFPVPEHQNKEDVINRINELICQKARTQGKNFKIFISANRRPQDEPQNAIRFTGNSLVTLNTYLGSQADVLNSATVSPLSSKKVKEKNTSNSSSSQLAAALPPVPKVLPQSTPAAAPMDIDDRSEIVAITATPSSLTVTPPYQPRPLEKSSEIASGLNLPALADAAASSSAVRSSAENGSTVAVAHSAIPNPASEVIKDSSTTSRMMEQMAAASSFQPMPHLISLSPSPDLKPAAAALPAFAGFISPGSRLADLLAKRQLLEKQNKEKEDAVEARKRQINAARDAFEKRLEKEIAEQEEKRRRLEAANSQLDQEEKMLQTLTTNSETAESSVPPANPATSASNTTPAGTAASGEAIFVAPPSVGSSTTSTPSTR